jgi:YVTN family beta-propeller protein
MLSTSVFVAGAPAGAVNKAYIVQPDANAVSVVDTTTRAVVNSISVGTGPTYIVVTRDGAKAYVANSASNSVSEIDTATGVVSKTFPLGASPLALAVTSDGQFLYVMTAAGNVDVVDTADGTVSSTILIGAVGDIAITPDDAHVYVAAGLVHVIETSTGTVISSFLPETESSPDLYNIAARVAITPDGASAYISTITYNFGNSGFSATGSVVIVDTATGAITGDINTWALPGPIAFTPDGSRAYVAIQAIWVNTGYGAGFIPGRTAHVVDTAAQALVASIDFGGDGAAWTLQNTPVSLGVTPDRSAVYASIPRIGAVAVVDVNTNVVTSHITVTGPGELAIVPDATAALVPYVVDAVDESTTATVAGGANLLSVLDNDTFGGIRATPAHVRLAQQSSTSDALTLDADTGAINIAAGAAPGSHELVYSACELGAASNCDSATVAVTIRAEFVIAAVDDSATSFTGRTALASVLANDTLGGSAATMATVTLTQVSATGAGLALSPFDGSVYVDAAAMPGIQTLVYRACEIASPSNCDEAAVTIAVTPYVVDAANDSGSAPRTGGIAVANVLANDTFAGLAATLGRVQLTQTTANANLALDAATGAVTVLAGAAEGTYAVGYRICEIANPVNCDGASVTVVVQPAIISAVNDSARASSKQASTALASVLSNDRIGGAPVAGKVTLSLVSLSPANSQIRLDLADGSVDVLGKTSSGLYKLVYGICETASPANCARATVTLDLSGGGK